MTRLSQKAEEEHFARRLVANLGLGPVLNVETPHLAPDILLRLPDRIVALEVTRIFRPTAEGNVPRQAQENYRRALLDAATKEWERRAGPHIEVLALFNDYVPISKSQIFGLAERLCIVVERELPGVNGWRRIEFDWDRRDDFLPEQLTSIRVILPAFHHRSYWNAGDAGFLSPLSATEIQRVIDAKATTDYAVKSAESWLLIVADSHHLSSSFDMSEEAIRHSYDSRFERIFLLDTFPNRVYELSNGRN